MYEDIKGRLQSGKACYISVQNSWSSSLLSKNIQIKIYRTIMLPVLYGCENWSVTLREVFRLKMFESRVQKNIFGSKVDEVRGERKGYIRRSFSSALYSSPRIVRSMKSKRACSA
jgi:hypothetical protein